MPQTAEWSKVVLQSMRGGLVSLARRIARLEERSSPCDAQPHHEHEDPLGPLFDALEALNSEHSKLHARLSRLEEARSPGPVQPPGPDDDPLGPLFDTLESINDELTQFAKRLALLEEYGPHVQLRPRSSCLVSSPRTSSAAKRAARHRRARKAVPRA
jgi:BMFP domain-containing protein YqiC